MLNVIYKKTLELGKIDYDCSGKKNCLVTLEIELRKVNVFVFEDIYHNKEQQEAVELSICGNIWNPRKTDIYCGGQCLDTIAEYFKDKKFKRILQIWNEYHLNTMQAGCVHQIQGDYNKVEISSQVCPHTGYKYGSAWLYKTIPDAIIEEIKSF